MNFLKVILITMIAGIANAHAGPARCGDVRTIERDGFCSTFSESCGNLIRNDPSALESCAEKAQSNVFEKTADRLQKFRSECTQIGGKPELIDQKITGGPWVYDEFMIHNCTTKYHGYQSVARPSCSIIDRISSGPTSAKARETRSIEQSQANESSFFSRTTKARSEKICVRTLSGSPSSINCWANPEICWT
jgi:hypothetical protein